MRNPFCQAYRLEISMLSMNWQGGSGREKGTGPPGLKCKEELLMKANTMAAPAANRTYKAVFDLIV